MVTDAIMDAVDLLIEHCNSREQAAGMESLKEMLGNFDEDAWCRWEDEARKAWVGKFLTQADTVTQNPKFSFRGRECWWEIVGMTDEGDILFTFAPTQDTNFIDEDGFEYFINCERVRGEWSFDRYYTEEVHGCDARCVFCATSNWCFLDPLTDEECGQIIAFAEDAEHRLLE